jgi:hypothetical protein
MEPELQITMRLYKTLSILDRRIQLRILNWLQTKLQEDEDNKRLDEEDSKLRDEEPNNSQR